MSKDILFVLWLASCFLVGQAGMGWILLSDNRVARKLRKHIPGV